MEPALWLDADRQKRSKVHRRTSTVGRVWRKVKSNWDTWNAHSLAEAADHAIERSNAG
jgi:hypothetical protein